MNPEQLRKAFADRTVTQRAAERASSANNDAQARSEAQIRVLEATRRQNRIVPQVAPVR